MFSGVIEINQWHKMGQEENAIVYIIISLFWWLMNEISTLYFYLQIEGLLLEGCSFDGTMITENDRSSTSVSNVPECSVAWIAKVSVFNFFFFNYAFIRSLFEFVINKALIMFKVNNKDARTTPMGRRSGFSIANFEHVLHFVILFLLLTLSR